MKKGRFILACSLWFSIWHYGPAQTLQRFEFTHPQMGTLFRIVLYAGDAENASKAATAAFARIDSLNATFSDYLNDSELSRLSATAGSGESVPVSDDLWTVLTAARQLSLLSDGAFDITIGPLSRLWRRAFRRQAFPEPERIDAARRLVGFPRLSLDSSRQDVRLSLSGMRLDAGGIAKGYAVDAAMAVLLRYGIHRALIDGGGDLLAGDPPPNAPGWRIQRMENNGKALTFLSNRAIATSGDTYRYLEWEGRRYSHIIDPRTGMGITESKLVTVEAPNCMTADALASAISILGKEAAAKLIAHYPGCSFQISKEQEPSGSK